jgi:hypothetical protein
MVWGKPSCKKIWIFKSPNVMLWVVLASLGPFSVGFVFHIFSCRCPCISGARCEQSVVCFSEWFTTNKAMIAWPVSNPKVYHMCQCVHELGRAGLVKDLLVPCLYCFNQKVSGELLVWYRVSHRNHFLVWWASLYIYLQERRWHVIWVCASTYEASTYDINITCSPTMIESNLVFTGFSFSSLC